MTKVKLGDVVVRIKEKVDKDNTELIYYVGGEHFDSRTLTVKKKGLIKGSTIGPAFNTKFKSGDVLLMSRNPHLRKAGMVGFDGICSDVSYIIRTKDEKVLMQKFIPIIFQSDEFWNFAEKNKKGSTNFFLNWSNFEHFEFELPGIAKQKRLSEIIWAMEDTIESYQKMIAANDELLKAKFIEMFGDPNHGDIKNKLVDAFTVRDDLRKPLNDVSRSEMRANALYPYYGANGQVDIINQYLTDYNVLCIAEDCGSYGAGEESSYILCGKAWVNNHAHVLYPNPNCNLVYANIFLRLLDISQYVNGTTRSKLTKETLKKLPFILPDYEDQCIFEVFANDIYKTMDNLKKISDLLCLSKKLLIDQSLNAKEDN